MTSHSHRSGNARHVTVRYMVTEVPGQRTIWGDEVEAVTLSNIADVAAAGRKVRADVHELTETWGAAFELSSNVVWSSKSRAGQASHQLLLDGEGHRNFGVPPAHLSGVSATILAALAPVARELSTMLIPKREAVERRLATEPAKVVKYLDAALAVAAAAQAAPRTQPHSARASLR
eukprot:5832282-Prymnesium_polylepis.1